MPEPARRKPWYRLRNVLLAIAAVIFLLITYVVVETLQVYTGEPKITRDYRAEFRALSEKAAGVPPGSGDEAWALLADAAARCKDIVKQYEIRIRNGEMPARSIPGDGFDDPSVNFALVLEGRRLPDGVQREIDVIRLLRDAGVFDRLSEFAAKGPGFRAGDPSTDMVSEFIPEYGDLRTLAKARAASMRLALVNSDHGELVRAFSDLLCMTRTVSLQPGLISALVAQATNSLTLSELRHLLAEGQFDANTSQALLDAIDRNEMAGIDLVLKGEQATFHDMVQRFFVDDGRGNGYINHETLNGVSGGGVAAQRESLWGAAIGRFVLPSKRDTEQLYDQFVEQCLTELVLPPAHRWQRGFEPEQFARGLSSRHAIVKLIIPAIAKSFSSYDRSVQDYEATRVMIALELFHALRKRWPSSLDELAPETLPQPPRDPLHGGPFGYRPLDDDPHGRPYLLYSFGLDEQDDGGAMRTPVEPGGFTISSDDYKVLSDRAFGGLDFVFNVPRPPSQLQDTEREASDLDHR